MQLKFIIFILLITSIEVFPDEFYTISICSTSTYEDAVFCKNKILKKHDYDITIVKINNTKYRTNYGVFNSFEDAKKVEKTLDYDIKQQQ
jgi:L,D-transpeptidase YcfS